MQITLVTQPFAAIETDALVSYVFEETDPVQSRIAELDKAAAGLLRKLAKSGELTGKMLEFTLVHAPSGLKAARLLLVGAGKREQWNGATLRKIAGAALRYPKARSSLISKPTNTRPTRKTTRTSKLSCSPASPTRNALRETKVFRRAISS